MIYAQPSYRGKPWGRRLELNGEVFGNPKGGLTFVLKERLAWPTGRQPMKVDAIRLLRQDGKLIKAIPYPRTMTAYNHLALPAGWVIFETGPLEDGGDAYQIPFKNAGRTVDVPLDRYHTEGGHYAVHTTR